MTRNPSQHGKNTGSVTTDVGTEPPVGEHLPLIIGHAEMDAAFERGDAVPVSQSIGWLMRYRAAWWVIYEDGWLRVIEGPIAASIDQLYPRLAVGEAAARNAKKD